MKYEGDGDTNYNLSAWNNPQRIGKGIGKFRYKTMSGDCLNYSIIKIRQNTEKSPGDEE